MRIYFIAAMTGRTGQELVEQARNTAFLCWCFNVEALDPIMAEEVEAIDKPLSNGGELLKQYWARDKAMIREAHVVIDRTAWMKSEGSAHEGGYTKYHLHKPILRVFPGLKESVARLEDDLIVETEEEAIQLAVKIWGTSTKRLKWKWMIFKKSYWNLLRTRLNWFIDWRD